MPSSVPQSIDSRRETHALLMHVLIASLDACPCSPQHNSTENINPRGATQLSSGRPIPLHFVDKCASADSNSPQSTTVSLSSACTTKSFSSRCASAIQIVRPWESIADTPRPTGFVEKADHHAVHFGIKSRSGQRRALGTQLRARFASRTQMNVRRPLIVKKGGSFYESVELNRRTPAIDSRRSPDPTSRMDRAKWRLPRM